MTKAEYMKRLQEKLEAFGKELQEDILEDYRQHFAEGELQGKTDEEIIEELGNIEDMIRDLPESELEENIRKAVPDMEEPGPKLSEGETDFGERQFHYSGKYTEVVFGGKEADILLEASEDEELHVEYINSFRDGQMKYEYYQYVKNDIFYAGIRRREAAGESAGKEGSAKAWKMTLFGKTIISYNKNMGRGEGQTLALVVKVPGGISRLSVKTLSGDIRVHQLALDTLQLVSASGDQEVSGVTSDIVDFQASSGDIKLGDIVCRERFELKTFSGDINMNRMELKQAGIRASSGDISLNDVKCGETLFLEGNSGDVSLANVTAGALQVQNASGDISIAGTRYATGNVESSSGDISFANVEFETGNCSVRSGDIVISNLRFSTGSFTSSQGDITLNNAEFETGKFTTEIGDVSGCNTKAEFAGITSGRGDIALRDDQGRCCRAYQCRTESGDIVIHSCSEIYECIAQRGDIEIDAAGLSRKVTLQSASGDIRLNAKGTPESVDMHSENGDIQLKLEEAQGMEITVEAGWGDAQIKWAGDRKEVKKGTFTYGNGASKVKVSSKNGDVNVYGGH